MTADPSLIEEITQLLASDEAEAIKRIKARMAAGALGLIVFTSEEVALARALLNKHEPDKKATEITGKGGGPVLLQYEDRKV